MGVSVKKNIALFQRRKIIFVENMTVGRINEPVSGCKHRIVGKNREFQHHLVNLCVAVAPDAEYFIFFLIEHSDNLFRRIFIGQIVSRPVIKNIAEQQEPVRLFIFIFFNQPAAIKSRAVDI